MFLLNGKIWLKDEIKQGHIYINEQSGKIDKIFWSKPSNIANYGKKIDLDGKLVIPSLIDIHCHLRDFDESNKETFFTGAKAAAAGGFTHVFDMPNKKPPIVSSTQVSKIKKIVKEIEEIDIIPYLLLNENTHIPFRYEYPFLKAYLGLTTGEYLTTEFDVEDFLANSSSFLSVHCEDNDLIENSKKELGNKLENHCKIRGPDTELNSISTLIKLKRKIKSIAPLHVAHVTLTKSIELLKKERISFEVTPHHLLLNTTDFKRLGVWGKMNPPLRAKTEQKNLFSMFIEGRIPIIATDHAPHTIEEKRNDFMSGIPGFETALASLLDKVKPLDPSKLKLIIDATAINPRKLMNLQSKGIIAVGEIADLTIIDSNLVKKVTNDDLFTKCHWSPWEGEELKGWPVLTIHNGIITYNNL